MIVAHTRTHILPFTRVSLTTFRLEQGHSCSIIHSRRGEEDEDEDGDRFTLEARRALGVH